MHTRVKRSHLDVRIAILRLLTWDRFFFAMKPIPAERLAGVVTGAFLFRVLSALPIIGANLTVGDADFAMRLKVSAPPVASVIVGAALGGAYLTTRRPRWLHIVTITLVALGVVPAIAVSLWSNIPSARAVLFSQAVVQSIQAIAIIACVGLLWRKDSQPNPSDKPPLSQATPL